MVTRVGLVLFGVLRFLRLVKKKGFNLPDPQGQILDASRFGMWVKLLSGSEDVSTIVEIGTWKGLGSTKIIADAIRERENVVALSLEANESIHRIARSNLSQYAQGGLELIHGTIVGSSELSTELLSAEEKKWLQDDLDVIERAPRVEHLMPDNVDFLLLDGGEFSSEAEFKFFENRLKRWLLLDDTKVRKNRNVEMILQSSANWIRCDFGDDRNGWSVWLRLQA